MLKISAIFWNRRCSFVYNWDIIYTAFSFHLGTTMSWWALIIAGLLEIGWAIGLKYTQGFTKLVPSLYTGATMFASFALLSYALREIPVGTGYAVWTGIGAAGTLLFGMLFLDESRDLIRIFCISTIIFCIILLKISSK